MINAGRGFAHNSALPVSSVEFKLENEKLEAFLSCMGT